MTGEIADRTSAVSNRPVFFKIDGTVSVLKRRLFLPHTFPDSMSLAQRARNF